MSRHNPNANNSYNTTAPVMNQQYARQVAASNDPASKISYLKNILQMPNVSSAQQTRIYQLINEAEHQLLTQKPPSRYPQQQQQQSSRSQPSQQQQPLSRYPTQQQQPPPIQSQYQQQQPQQQQSRYPQPPQLPMPQPSRYQQQQQQQYGEPKYQVDHQMGGAGAIGHGDRQLMDRGVSTNQRQQLTVPIRGSFLSPHQPLELMNGPGMPINSSNPGLGMGSGQLVASSDSLSKQFSTQHQLAEAFTEDEQTRSRRFEMEQARRAKAFEDEQRQRRKEYETQLHELESKNINSLRVFGLTPDYTLDELKHTYKRKALEVHPDRPGGDPDKFRLVTKCYLELIERLKEKAKQADIANLQRQTASSNNTATPEQQDRLRQMFRERNEALIKGGKDAAAAQRPALAYNLDPSEKGFDVKLFNKIYEDNKLWDPSDEGYGDFLRSDEVDTPALPKGKELFGDEFNLDLFNQTFQDQQSERQSIIAKQEHPAEVRDIVHKNSTRDLVAIGVGGTPLDMMSSQRKQSRVNLYDGDDNVTSTNLLTAYKYNGGIINPTEVKPRQEYKNVQELMRDRENISFQLTPEDARRQAEQLEKEKQEEERRRQRIQDQLNMVDQHHNILHQRMLGSAPSKELPDYNNRRR